MTSRLAEMQARFQQKQIQEKEEKLLRLYENQQQRAFEKVNRGSAGSTTSVGSTGGGKVRQMFDERRQKAGVDRSHPLEPMKKLNGQTRGNSVDRIKNPPTTTSRSTVIKSTVQKSVSQIRNGKPVVNRREVVQAVYNNNNGIESYEEHKFEDGNGNAFDRSHRDLIEMMNNHNLNGSLEDEMPPQIGFDEVDNGFVTGKLSNVGGKLPSESKTTNLSRTTKTVQKPINDPKKKTIKTVVSSPARTSSVASKASSASPSTTPLRSVSQAKPASKVLDRKSPMATVSKPKPNAKQVAKTAVARDDLTDCQFCGRRFAEDRLQVHMVICGKTQKKKRKAYDATKHRLQGTELEQYSRKGVKVAASRAAKSAPKKDWRKTHEEFISTIKAAKMAQAYVAKGGKLSDLPPPPPSSNPDYIQCPHCGRKFNEAAGQRHIPQCANYSFNKPKAGAASKGKLGRK